MDDGFTLTVTVAAEEWARLNMRVQYLEAAVVQAYRNERQLREWFAVSDLLSMELPGLPTSRQGILRKAQAEHWLTRSTVEHGRERYEFHFSALPRHAFAELIRRIVSAPDGQVQAPAGRKPSGAPRQRPLPSNAEPPWMLPLMRLLRRDSAIDPEAACRLLSETLPGHVAPPTKEEVAAAVHRLHSRSL